MVPTLQLIDMISISLKKWSELEYVGKDLNLTFNRDVRLISTSSVSLQFHPFGCNNFYIYLL